MQRPRLGIPAPACLVLASLGCSTGPVPADWLPSYPSLIARIHGEPRSALHGMRSPGAGGGPAPGAVVRYPNLDLDGDGLSRLAEDAYGTDPLLADTDGDGEDDLFEIAAGCDPLDPASNSA